MISIKRIVHDFVIKYISLCLICVLLCPIKLNSTHTVSQLHAFYVQPTFSNGKTVV